MHPLTAELTIDTLKSIIPAEVEHAINLNLLGNKNALTYAELKKLITDHVGEEQPVPMDVGEVAEQQDEQAAAGGHQDDVCSLGAAVGLGKGKGKGGAGGWSSQPGAQGRRRRTRLGQGRAATTWEPQNLLGARPFCSRLPRFLV